ncbi:GtrA family protein [Vibrio rotiferianus]|uniref:GtrA family protein n=1 Tax=Vibrio rotiferianus TaxID=190895 RepID=UPI00406AA704
MDKFARFAFIGGIGFAVDTLIFALLFHWLSSELMLARACAFLFAATTTWLGNRYLTFYQSKKDHPFRQWRKFMISACISAIPNFVVFKGTTLWLGEQGIAVYIALVMGILVGMCSNFVLSSRWVFAK